MRSLSLCTHFRDGYDGDSLYRLQTALDFLALSGLNENIDVLICDWGCPEPLLNRIKVHPWLRTSVVRVEPKLVAELEAGQGYSMPMALNTAIRRATGDYILTFDPDICLTIDCDFGKKWIDPEGFGYLPRRRIPQCVVAQKPTARQVHAVATRNWHRLKADGLGFGYFNPVAGFMMSKDQWLAMGGYDESLFGWGWLDTNFTLRASQHYENYDLTEHSISAYHLDHRNTFTPDTPKCYVDDMPDFQANYYDWGLGEEKMMPIGKPEHHARVPDELPCLLTNAANMQAVVDFVQEKPGCTLLVKPDWSDRTGLGPTDSWAYGFNKTLTEHDCWPGYVRIITG